MKFKGATKPLLKQWEKLATEREAAFMAILAAAHPRMDVPWQTCFRDYAARSARERYLSADRATLHFQLEMSAQRRGYFENGRFSWYR